MAQRPRARRGIFSMIMLGGLMACSSQPDFGPRASIGLMSALPLFWHEESSPSAMISGKDQRAPLVTALAAHHKVKPLDVLDAAGLKRIEVLILAQPRLLQPGELVALDSWIRRGGRALIFADPELAWPSDLPLGDRRRAPLISLLDPLYRHWGLSLDGPSDHNHADPINAEIAGHSVTLTAPGRWQASTDSGDCRFESGGLVADCQLGSGRVILVADADLLDGRVWAEAKVDGSQAVLALVARLTEVRGMVETGREHLKDRDEKKIESPNFP